MSDPQVRSAEHHTSTSLRVALLLTFGNGFLDVYTFLTHGVFATAQTGNVVLLFVGMVQDNSQTPLPHLWPILAFLAGILLASLIRTESMRRLLKHPVRWALLVQILLLAIVAVLPASTPVPLTTTMISFGAALQLGLFRVVRTYAYVTIATTGNLMRLAETAFQAVRSRQVETFRLLRLYISIFASFVVGAVAGALVTDAWRLPACWVVVAVITAALALFYVDDYRDTGSALGHSGHPGRTGHRSVVIDSADDDTLG